MTTLRSYSILPIVLLLAISAGKGTATSRAERNASRLNAPLSRNAMTTSLVSLRKPDGLVLSAANLYFTSHDATRACAWRTAQSSRPGQEIALYCEPYARFGDIVYAQVDCTWWGYFFAMSGGVVTIKRIPLTGGPATVLTTTNSIDIENSHRNLVTEGVNLYWQDATSVRKMPIRGGAVTVLDTTSPSTPTAGLALQNGNVIYAHLSNIRYVPTSGSIISPLFRRIAKTPSRVTALSAVTNGVLWGDQSGAIRLKVGSVTTTLQSSGNLVPTSVAINKTGAAEAWTQCGSSQPCRLHLRTGAHFPFPVLKFSMSIGAHALGATMTSSRTVFWGDAAGVHRQVF